MTLIVGQTKMTKQDSYRETDRTQNCNKDKQK